MAPRRGAPRPPRDRVTRVVIACAGLGRVHRGFETLARECFDSVRGTGKVDVTLLKGAGRSPGRDSRTVALVARATGRDAEMVAQQAFAVATLPQLFARQPDVTFVSEWWTALALIRLRRLGRLRFRLLLSNGGPYEPGTYGWADHVHQPTEHELEAAVAAGMPRERQTLLPQGVVMHDQLLPLPPVDRAALRERLRLPREGPILLSVAALNSSHKR